MKKKKWIRFRHKITRDVVNVILSPYMYIKYHIKATKYKENLKEPYLIIYNHQTAFDQFFIGKSFKKPLYYLATEDLFSNGFISRVIEFLIKPIPIKKNVSDLTAVKKCIQVVREGGSIAIAPEGNRTFSGETMNFNPAIIKLVKLLKIPLLIYRIEGGYGVEPRWGHKLRKGKMKSYVYQTVLPETYLKMTDEELGDLIKKGLYVNEHQSNELFKSKRKAEYLERVAYVCPKCGLTTFYSKGNVIRCTKCNLEVEYTDDKKFKPIDKISDFPFNNYLEWYNYQNDYINNLDLTKYFDELMYTETGNFFIVHLYKHKERISKDCTIKLYGNKVEIQTKSNDENKYEFLFEDITGVSVLGRNKLNIYYKDNVYQIKSNKRFNAVKYLNIWYRFNNQIKNPDSNSKFLGL